MSEKKQTERDNIQVSIRIKPLQEEGRASIKLDANLKNTIIIDGNNSQEQKYFYFDYVAPQEATQEDIFEIVGKQQAINCLEGYNGCVFVYGQTGSGKTYTMMGTQKQPGLLPRVIEFLFQCIYEDSPENVEYLLKCSYLEIYNEHIIDLLNPQSGNLQLREDLKKGVYVEYLSEESCTNVNDALEVLARGSSNRHISQTNMNIESSRSHSVFTVQVESRRQSSQTQVINHRFSRFHFVDLAGSERQKQSQVAGDRLREGCNINKSLHILGNVINALVDDSQQNKYVHYRDSKLTFLLKDSLGGNSRTHLIANIQQSQSYYQETLSTLMFSKRVKQVRNKARINEDDSGNLESLKNEIKRLKQELARNIIQNQWESPRKIEQKSVLQSEQFLHSLELEGLVVTDQKYIKLEEILKCYLEQSTESETSLRVELDKYLSGMKQLKEGFQMGQQLEQQLKLIIRLQNEQIQRLKNKNGIEDITMPVCNYDQILVAKIFHENVQLREQQGGNQIIKAQFQVEQNIQLLRDIVETVNNSLEERKQFQNQIDQQFNSKYVGLEKFQDLEIQSNYKEKLLEEQTEKLIQIEERMHQLDQDLEEKDTKIREQDQLLQTLKKSEEDTSKSQQDEYQQQSNQMQTKIDEQSITINQQLITIDQQNKKINEQNITIEEYNFRIQEQNATIQSQLIQIEEQLKSNQIQLEQQQDHHQIELQSFQSDLIKQLKNQEANFIAQISEIQIINQQQLQALNQSISEKDQQLNLLKQDKSELNNYSSSLNQQRDNFQQELKEIQLQLSEQQEQYKQLQQQLFDKDQTIIELKQMQLNEQSNHQSQINQIMQENQQKQSQTQSELTQIIETQQSELTQITKTHQLEIAQITKNHQSELSTTLQEYQSTQNTAIIDLQQKLETLLDQNKSLNIKNQQDNLSRQELQLLLQSTEQKYQLDKQKHQELLDKHQYEVTDLRKTIHELTLHYEESERLMLQKHDNLKIMQNEQFESDILTLQQQHILKVNELQRELAVAVSVNSEYEQSLSVMRINLESVTKQLESKQALIQETAQNFNQVHEQYRNLEEQLSTQNLQYSEQINELQLKLFTYENEISNLEQKLQLSENDYQKQKAEQNTAGMQNQGKILDLNQKLQNKMKQIEQQQITITAMKNEWDQQRLLMNNLEQQNTEQNYLIEALKQHNEELKMQQIEQQNALEESKNHIQDHQLKYNQTLQTLQSENQQSNQMQQEISQLQRNENELQQQLKQSTSKLQQLEENLKLSKSIEEQQKQQITILKNQSQQLMKSNIDMENELKLAQEKLEIQASDHENQLEEQQNILRKSTEIWRKETDSLETENSELLDQIKQLQIEIVQKQEENSNLLDCQIPLLQDVLKQKGQQIENLVDQLTKYELLVQEQKHKQEQRDDDQQKQQKQIDKTQKTLQDRHRKEIQDLVEQLQINQSELENREQQIQELSQQIDGLQCLFEQRDKQIEEIQKESSTLKEKAIKYHKLAQGLEQNNRQLQNQVEQYENRIKTHEIHIHENQDKYQLLKEQFVRLESQSHQESQIRDQYNHISDKLGKENQDLKQKLDKKQHIITQLEQALIQNEETLKNVHEKAKEFCKMQEKEINDIKDQYLKLESEHNAILSQNQEREEENESMRDQKDQAINQLTTLKEDLNVYKIQEGKLRKELQDQHEKLTKANNERQMLYKQIEEMQNDIQQLGGHNNPSQKIRYLNQIKQENSCLKQEKLYLSEQLQKEIEEKNKLSNKQEFGKIDVQKLIQENQRMNQEMQKLNQILNLTGVKSRYSTMKGSEGDKIIQSVQLLIQELIDCKQEIQQRNKEQECKNIKYQTMEKDLLLMKQRYFAVRDPTQKALSPNHEQQILKDTRVNMNNGSAQRQIKGKQTFQFQQQ